MARNLHTINVGRIATLLTTVILAVGGAMAQTNVSGNITLDTTWDIAGSPYIVTNSVTVIGTDGADAVTTLTIDPGVEVRFSNVNAQLSAGNFSTPGRLVADGDSGPGAPAQIVFTSHQATPAPGDWRRILLDGDAGGSVLRNVLVEYAGRNSFDGGAVNVSHSIGSVLLDQLLVRDVNYDGILLNTGAFTLSNCAVENATLYSIQVDNSATITGSVSNCALESILYNFGANADVDWLGNTFTNWGAVTSRVGIQQLGQLLTQNTIASRTPDAVVEILANSNLEVDSTWSADAGTIRLLGTSNVRGTDGVDGVTTLTIEPGVRVELGNFAQLSVATFSTPGAMIADGDSGPGAPAEIIFSSSNPSPSRGDWRRIYFDRSADPSSLLRNVRVEYAGQLNNDSGVHLFQNTGTITLDDVTIADSGHFGLRIAGPVDLSNSSIGDTDLAAVQIDSVSGLVGSVSNSTIDSFVYAGSFPVITWQNNTFDNWGAVQSVAAPDAVASLTTGGNSFTNPVPGARLEVLAGSVVSDGSWGPAAGPLEMKGTLTIVGTDGPDSITTVTMLAGVRVEFPSNAELSAGKTGFPSGPGELIVDGNAGPEAPAAVVLTSASDNPAAGDWKGVKVVSTSGPATRFRNAIIEYAGQSSLDAGIVIGAPALTVPLETMIVRESATDGIRFLSGGVDVSNCLIYNTFDHSIDFTDNDTLIGSVSDSSLESIYYNGGKPQIDWVDNIFENWGETTSRVIDTDFESLSQNNSFNRVPDGVAGVLSSKIELDSSWAKHAGPIALEGSMLIEGTDGADGVTTLTLEPGVEIRLAANKELFVGSSGSIPGKLVADGRTGPGTAEAILISSSEPVPGAGQTDGIQVLSGGIVELYETVVKYADTAVQVSGTIAAIDGLTVAESAVGVLLTSAATPPPTLERMFFLGCDVGFSAAYQFVTIRNSNLEGATFGVQNYTPAAFCIDAADNWWGDASGPSGAAPAQGCEFDFPSGGGSPITEGVIFDSYLSAALDPSSLLGTGGPDGVRFADGDTLAWDPLAHAVEYHVYRQSLSSVGAGSFSVCRDDLDIDTTDVELEDLELPLPGQGFSYLVTAEDCLGLEGSLGDATAGERVNLTPCP